MTGGTLTGTSDIAYFRHHPVSEGSDIRVNLSSPSTSGLSGAMVRDSEESDAPFAFVGKNPAGEVIILFRRRAGEAPESINLGVQATWDWFQLTVGRSSVYVYTATHDYDVTNGPNVWQLQHVAEVELIGDDDLGGAAVVEGSATFSTIIKTDPLLWTEKEARVDELDSSGASIITTQGTWNQVSSADAVSSHYLEHSGGTDTDYVEFPLNIAVSGSYRIYVHTVGGIPANQDVEVNGVAPTSNPTVTLAGGSSWTWVGSQSFTLDPTTTSNPNRVRVYSSLTESVRVDAVKAVRDDIAGWDGVAWQKQGSNRTNRVGTNGTTSSGLKKKKRNSSDSNYNKWNGGGYGYYRLYGDFAFQFQLPVNDLTLKVGVGLTAGDSGYSSIAWRLNFSGSNRRVTATGGGASTEHFYNSDTWHTVERIGDRILFRKNGNIILESSVPTDAPLYLDSSLKSLNSRFRYSRTKGWRLTTTHTDLDGDGSPDSLEQLVIDADPEDDIQSFWDVDMSEDLDGDNLTNLQEVSPPSGTPATNPTLADTDGDTLRDDLEIQVHGTDPTDDDTDHDGLRDDLEISLAHLGFSALSANSDYDEATQTGDLVGDFTEWEIINEAQNDSDTSNDHIDGQDDVDGTGDFDGDAVIDLHESEDGTSAVDADDYFFPVLFSDVRENVPSFGWKGGLGKIANAERQNTTGDPTTPYVEHPTGSGIYTTSIIRQNQTEPVPAGESGAYSHHYVKDGSRLRFQFADVSKKTSVGFELLNFDGAAPQIDPGDDPNYGARIAATGSGTIGFYFADSLVAGSEFSATSSDLIEIRMEMNSQEKAIVIEKEKQEVYRYPLNYTIDFTQTPMVVAVRFDEEGAGITNARYRRVEESDVDEDDMRDIWEQEIIDEFPALYTDVWDVLPGDDADDDRVHVSGEIFTNLEEHEAGTKGQIKDTDGDLLWDGWEVEYGLNPRMHDNVDSDGDELVNFTEHRLMKDEGLMFYPNDSDSDDDGLSDGFEYSIINYDPNDSITNQSHVYPEQDFDSDGLVNSAEVAADTEGHNPDSDGDQMHDGWEVEYNLDPNFADSATADGDNDGLNNLAEFLAGTNPISPDTDGDGLDDGLEIALGREPNTSPSEGAWTPSPSDPLGYNEGIDSDGDGAGDYWELMHDFDPGDSSDGVADPDYDGVSNADEFQEQTSIDLTWTWKTVHIGNLPPVSPFSGSGRFGTDVPPLVGSLNDLGQLADAEIVGTDLQLKIWDMGSWGAPVSMGDPGIYDEVVSVRQNNRGMAAVVLRKLFNSGNDGMNFVVKIKTGSGAIYELGTGEAWAMVTDVQVHDSNIVTGVVRKVGETDFKFLRWIEDETELTPAPTGESLTLARDHSERGELITGDSVLRRSGWESHTGGEVIAVGPYGESWVKSGAPYFGRAFQEEDGSSVGGIALNSSQSNATGVDANIWVDGILYTISDPDYDPNDTNPIDGDMVPIDLGDQGDVVGARGRDYYDDITGNTDFLWTGFYWSRGELELISRGDNTRIYQINRSGHMLVHSWSGVNNPTPYEKWELRVPDNDSDSNGLPDDWESHHSLVSPVDPNAQTDGDGLHDRLECALRTDPNSQHSDGDPFEDNYELDYGLNPRATEIDNDEDIDGDGLDWFDEKIHNTDPYDPDSDDDELSDGDEVNIHDTDPNDKFTDEDEFPDGWEVRYGYDPKAITDRNDDADNDNLSLWREFQFGTEADNPDTDGDTYTDGVEVIQLNSDPKNPNDPVGDPTSIDPDLDGLTTEDEINIHGTDPLKRDTNDDGIVDSVSIALGIDPVETDHDGDGLTNAQELARGSDPFEPDSDGDGVNDDADNYPNDPTRTDDHNDPNDTTAPTVILLRPQEAV
ncbi:MAG: hypothetical protein MI807_04530, partial [Verrucomicrobiales bacterium]|nr:hypothetical protein [Verrucomicrobiales bacterium]